MSKSWRRFNQVLLGIGLGLTAANGPAVRAQAPYPQAPYPGAGYPSPVNSASLVRILLTDLDPGRRISAARLLGDSGDPKTIQALSTAAVEDPDPRVRQAATDALSQIRGALGGGVVPTPAPPPWGPINPLGPPVVQPAPVFQAPPVDPQVELVQSWYQRYLRRSIDLSGLQGWVGLLRQGASRDDVQASILGSPEYYQLQGNAPDRFVAGLYGDVLGRAPNREELLLWLNRLGQFRNDRPRLAFDFLRACHGELHRHPAYGHYPLR